MLYSLKIFSGKAMSWLALFIFVNIVICAHCNERCTTPKNETGICTPLERCSTILKQRQARTISEEYAEKLICNGSSASLLICCPIPSRFLCGFQQSDDYPHETNETAINEFPWIARIAYRRANEEYEEYLCTGSLITPQYVLTAAHCISGDLKPVRVRLGEHHVIRNPDCIYDEKLGVRDCSYHVDRDIAKVILHPNYDEQNNIHDIGLIKLNDSIRYTDYTRSICLPSYDIPEPTVGNNLIISGWGWKTQPDAVFLPAKDKQKTSVKITSRENCKTLQINKGQMCSNYNSRRKCLYETGGPLMFSYRNQWFQEGVALSKSKNCWSRKTALLYTKVSYYFDWINENTK